MTQPNHYCSRRVTQIRVALYTPDGENETVTKGRLNRDSIKSGSFVTLNDLSKATVNLCTWQI